MIRRELIIGDIVAILLFATLGRAEHQTGLAPADVVGTALPFLISWFALAIPLGALRADAVQSPGRAAAKAATTWACAWPLGLLLRSLILSRGIPLTFALVVFAVNALLLIGWRTLYASWRGRGSRQGSGKGS